MISSAQADSRVLTTDFLKLIPVLAKPTPKFLYIKLNFESMDSKSTPKKLSTLKKT